MLTEEKLFQSQGVNVDLELSLFQADHGDPTSALKTAAAEYARRHSTLVEDAYGWALHMNGDDKAALPLANAALRIGTKSALFYFHRGMIEVGLGMTSQAVGDLQAGAGAEPALLAVAGTAGSRDAEAAGCLVKRLLIVLFAAAGLLFVGAGVAAAHPLGNFTVNSFSALRGAAGSGARRPRDRPRRDPDAAAHFCVGSHLEKLVTVADPRLEPARLPAGG